MLATVVTPPPPLRRSIIQGLNQGVGLSTSRNKHGCSSYMIALLVVIKLEWQIGPPRSYACRCPTMQMLHYRSRCNTTIVLTLSGKKMGTGCVAGLWDLSIRVNLHVSTIKSQISMPCSMGLETFPLFSIRAPECNDRAGYIAFSSTVPQHNPRNFILHDNP